MSRQSAETVQQLHAQLTHAVQQIRAKAASRGDEDIKSEGTRAELLLMRLWTAFEARDASQSRCLNAKRPGLLRAESAMVIQ
jgi:hypothetical protein